MSVFKILLVDADSTILVLGNVLPETVSIEESGSATGQAPVRGRGFRRVLLAGEAQYGWLCAIAMTLRPGSVSNIGGYHEVFFKMSVYVALPGNHGDNGSPG